MVTFTIHIPQMLAYILLYTIHGSYGIHSVVVGFLDGKQVAAVLGSSATALATAHRSFASALATAWHRRLTGDSQRLTNGVIVFHYDKLGKDGKMMDT